MQIHQIPALRNPIAILAFNGWSDAGESATGLISHLMGAFGNQEILIAESDSEEFYDYQQIRPMVFIDNSKIISEAMQNGELNVGYAIYNIETGKVQFYKL